MVSSEEHFILILLVQSAAFIHGSSFFTLFHIIYHTFRIHVLGHVNINGILGAVIAASRGQGAGEGMGYRIDGVVCGRF